MANDIKSLGHVSLDEIVELISVSTCAYALSSPGGGGTATYVGTAGYAGTAGFVSGAVALASTATYAISASTAIRAGTAAYAESSPNGGPVGTSTYSITAGTSAHANTAGTSVYSGTAGFVNISAAATATWAQVAGIASTATIALSVSTAARAGTAAYAESSPGGGGEAFPVGSVFLAVVNTDPATLLGYGTWSQIAGGRVLIGQTGGDADFDVAEEIGGAKTHTLTAAEIPAHTHALARFPTTTGASSGFTADTSMSGTPTAVSLVTGTNTGGGAAHNNMPPYFVVYAWKRTA